MGNAMLSVYDSSNFPGPLSGGGEGSEPQFFRYEWTEQSDQSSALSDFVLDFIYAAPSRTEVDSRGFG